MRKKDAFKIEKEAFKIEQGQKKVSNKSCKCKKYSVW